MVRMFVGLCLASWIGLTMITNQAKAEGKSPLQVTMKTLDGQDVDLAKTYHGKVVLVVNVASKCGLTPQYKQLQALHEKYGSKGLAILGFPCNQFGKQEPGTSEEIASFCEKNYGVKFDMFAKIDVNKESAAELYKMLTAADTQPVGKGDISWNFEKFLIGRDGQLVARFSPRTKPDDAELIAAIEKELAK
jgi:glutathione peroxidase